MSGVGPVFGILGTQATRWRQLGLLGRYSGLPEGRSPAEKHLTGLPLGRDSETALTLIHE